jgi:hypothetical protein
MPGPHTFAGAMYLLQILPSAFLAILFLQSGIDKVVDRRGNLEWLKGQPTHGERLRGSSRPRSIFSAGFKRDLSARIEMM